MDGSVTTPVLGFSLFLISLPFLSRITSSSISISSSTSSPVRSFINIIFNLKSNLPLELILYIFFFIFLTTSYWPSSNNSGSKSASY